MLSFNNKSEEECRELMDMSERFAHRYMQMLNRFEDLPGCDEIIMRLLKDDFPPDFIEGLKEDFDEEMPDGGLSENEDGPEAMENGIGADMLDDPEAMEEEMNADPQMKSLRQMYMNLDQNGRQAMFAMYQVMMNWTVVYAMILPQKFHARALAILMGIARALGNVHGAFDALSEHNFNLANVMTDRACMFWKSRTEALDRLKLEWIEGGELLHIRLKDMRKVEQLLGNVHSLCRKIQHEENGF